MSDLLEVEDEAVEVVVLPLLVGAAVEIVVPLPVVGSQ